MSDPYDCGDWTEDYHSCRGEYGCESDGRCPLVHWKQYRAADTAGRHRRPRTVCGECGQVTGIAPKGTQ